MSDESDKNSKPNHAVHALAIGGAVAVISKLNNRDNWLINGAIAGALAYGYMYKFGHGLPTFGSDAKDEPDLENKIVDRKPAPTTPATTPATTSTTTSTPQPDPTTISPADLHTVHNNLHPDDDADDYNNMVNMYRDAYM